MYALSDGASSYSLTPNSPLPHDLSKNKEAAIFVGDDVATDKPEEIILFVRINNADSFSVSINGHALLQTNATYPKRYDKLRGITDKQKVSAFIVPTDDVTQGKNHLSFSSAGSAVIVQRIELALKYGDVEQYGYF